VPVFSQNLSDLDPQRHMCSVSPVLMSNDSLFLFSIHVDVRVMVFNSTFNSISSISLLPVLLEEEISITIINV
jgi:hypothetical protein